MNTKIKICGITNLADALIACELGADALGFIFASSPRMIDPAQAEKIIRKLPPFISTVGVFKDEQPEMVNQVVEYTGIDVVQLHGCEEPGYCQQIKCPRLIKRIRVEENSNEQMIIEQMAAYNVSAFVFDPGEGSGVVFDWNIVKNLKGQIVVAGGLNCDNIKNVIQLLHPYGVDVCTGVEKCIRIKDPEKIEKFIKEVRKCSLPV